MFSDCSERIVSHSEVIQSDGSSAFRPYCRDVVVFYTSTRWAFYVKLTPNRPTSGWLVIRSELRTRV